MTKKKAIAVFCGSSSGDDLGRQVRTQQIGQVLASHHCALVYGGASVGLMGVVADYVLSNGGEAIGVIPSFMKEKELAHQNLTQLHLVASMHERKALMVELASAFLILPGGPGTMDEFFEVFTWFQLGLHQKPIAIFNDEGYYENLKGQLLLMQQKGFLKQKHGDTLFWLNTLPELNMFVRDL
jgi:uncharacterized protein (TIGR00730 family)